MRLYPVFSRAMLSAHEAMIPIHMPTPEIGRPKSWRMAAAGCPNATAQQSAKTAAPYGVVLQCQDVESRQVIARSSRKDNSSLPSLPHGLHGLASLAAGSIIQPICQCCMRGERTRALKKGQFRAHRQNHNSANMYFSGTLSPVYLLTFHVLFDWVWD